MPSAPFVSEPSPDNPGWLTWDVSDHTRFNHAVIGPLLVRAEDDGTCRVRMTVLRHLTNAASGIHGGAILGLIDISLFAAMHVLKDVDASRSVTVDLSTQFVGAGDPGRPLDAVVEVLRETRRLGFLRGLVVQDDDVVSSFTGTVRKPSSP